MNRVARRGSIVLLWLLLALLPMRGWANGWMHLATADGSVAEAVAMPCHGDAAPADSGDSLPAPAGCTLCDLCHGVAMPASIETLAGDDAGSAWLNADASSLAPGQPNSFFRPPRA
jgi:hypothetical protein